MAVTIEGYICDMPADSNGRRLMMKVSGGTEYKTDPIYTSDPTFDLEIPGNGVYEVSLRRYANGSAYWAEVWAPEPFDSRNTTGTVRICVCVEDPTD